MSATVALLDYIDARKDLNVSEKVMFMNNKGKVVFGCLLLSKDEENVSALSYTDMQSITGFSKTTIIHIIDDLEADGLIVREKSSGTNTRYKIVYSEES